MDLMPISMPKDIDKYFFNRVKDIEMITTQLSMLEKDIPPQLLITGYRGVGLNVGAPSFVEAKSSINCIGGRLDMKCVLSRASRTWSATSPLQFPPL